MFDDLKQRRGFNAKEKSRLIVSGSLILILGAVIYGSKGCSEEPKTPPRARAREEPKPPEPPPEELDLAPFEDVRAGRGETSRFDTKALDHVLRALDLGRLVRTPRRVFKGPADLAAVDLSEWAGRLVEVRGRVRSIDKETYSSKDAPSADQLWAFALEGDDGSRVVVVQGGLAPEGGRPADAYHPSSARVPLVEGDFVRVRGIVLQRRTGSVGSLSLDTPTLVLAGREYRRTDSAVPDIPDLAAIGWASVDDRTMSKTWRVDDGVHFQLLHWAGTRGHDAVMAEVRARGPLPRWGQAEFVQFMKELDADTGQEADPRTWTVAQRGRVFETTGVFADYIKEDWDSVGPNDYDVGTRHKYWIVSDHYAHTLILMDSAFPLETFPGVRMPRKEDRVRVVATGVYVRNYSYTPGSRAGRKEGEREITVPYFHLLDLKMLPPMTGTPPLKNPFFWAWVSLAVFGAAFFLVMGRIEKRETAIMRETEKKARAGARRAADRREAASHGEPPPDASPPADRGPSAP
jgi:hypothetical protein